jgi:hypothetical protein
MAEATFTTKDLIESKLKPITNSTVEKWTLHHDKDYNPTGNSFSSLLPLVKAGKQFYWHCGYCNTTRTLTFDESQLEVWLYQIGESKTYYLCDCHCGAEERRGLLHLFNITGVFLAFKQTYIDITTEYDTIFSDFSPYFVRR